MVPGRPIRHSRVFFLIKPAPTAVAPNSDKGQEGPSRRGERGTKSPTRHTGAHRPRPCRPRNAAQDRRDPQPPPTTPRQRRRDRRDLLRLHEDLARATFARTPTLVGESQGSIHNCILRTWAHEPDSPWPRATLVRRTRPATTFMRRWRASGRPGRAAVTHERSRPSRPSRGLLRRLRRAAGQPTERPAGAGYFSPAASGRSPRISATPRDRAERATARQD